MQSASKDLGIKFEKQASELVNKLEDRLEVQMLVLRGTSGLFSSSAHVTPEEFHNYISSLKLQKTNVEGVLAVAAEPKRFSAFIKIFLLICSVAMRKMTTTISSFDDV